MKHDTPVDTPAVVPERRPQDVLASTRGVDSLEALYDVWGELRVDHAASLLRHAEERTKLEEQGAFLVGAVKAAAQPGAVSASAQTPPTDDSRALAALEPGLRDFLREAEGQLAASRAALEARIAEEETAFARSFADVKGQLGARVRRYLTAVKPRLTLLLRRLGQGSAILHLQRVEPDEAVLLLTLFAARLPTRYDYLFDDSTEDAMQAPPTLYPDEGVGADQVRPSATALIARLRAEGEAVPVKGFVPCWVPRPDGGEDFFRLLQRGPVMEVELREGDGFRSVLAREEAERFAGHLLRLKLEGKIQLEIRTE